MEFAKAPVSCEKLVWKARLQDAELEGILESYIERRLVDRGPVRDAFLAVGADCPMPVKALVAEAKKRLPYYPAKLIAAVVGQLVRAKLLRNYCAFGTGDQLVGRADCPAVYPAAAQGTISEGVLACLEPSGTAPVSTRELRAAVPNLPKLVIDRACLALRSHKRMFLSQRRVPLTKERSW